MVQYLMWRTLSGQHFTVHYSFLVGHTKFAKFPLIQHEMKKEEKFKEQRQRKRKIESHSLLALMPQELTRFLWQ